MDRWQAAGYLALFTVGMLIGATLQSDVDSIDTVQCIDCSDCICPQPITEGDATSTTTINPEFNGGTTPLKNDIVFGVDQTTTSTTIVYDGPDVEWPPACDVIDEETKFYADHCT